MKRGSKQGSPIQKCALTTALSDGKGCNEDTIVLTFPHIQKSLWKAFTKLSQFWGDQNCIFRQRKYSSPSRGEWNPSADLSSYKLREDIIQKSPWSIQTQTSSGTARAIQNTFKNNYKRHFQLLSHLCSEHANALKFSVLPLFNRIAELPVYAKCCSCICFSNYMNLPSSPCRR